MTKKSMLSLVALVALALSTTACDGMSRREQRAVSGGAIGAAGGAALGAITGGSALTGALIGGAGGAAVGALTR
jgi:osmotically inducible lipoprotein OsmB